MRDWSLDREADDTREKCDSYENRSSPDARRRAIADALRRAYTAGAAADRDRLRAELEALRDVLRDLRVPGDKL